MTDADMAKLQTFVVDASGRDDWKAEPEFWLPVKALLARHRLTLDGAKDATLAAWKRFGNSPSQLYRGLATVLDESKQVNLPAANDAAPCGLCGFQGLVVIERRDGRRIEVRIGAECCDVGYITVVCTCPHGARLQAAWGERDRTPGRYGEAFVQAAHAHEAAPDALAGGRLACPGRGDGEIALPECPRGDGRRQGGESQRRRHGNGYGADTHR